MNEQSIATASERDEIIELTDAEIATVTGAMTDRGDTYAPAAMTDRGD